MERRGGERGKLVLVLVGSGLGGEIRHHEGSLVCLYISRVRGIVRYGPVVISPSSGIGICWGIIERMGARARVCVCLDLYTGLCSGDAEILLIGTIAMI